MKLAIFALGIVSISFLSCISVYAQDPSNSTNLSNPLDTTPLSDIINPKFPNKEIEVLSETPNTLILTVAPDVGYITAETIDLVKLRGYVIDAVTAFVPPLNATQTNYPELYTIFFSR